MFMNKLIGKYYVCGILVLWMLSFSFVAGAEINDEVDDKPVFNDELYNSYIVSAISTEEEIIEDYEWQQVIFMPLLFPSGDSLMQNGGILPVKSWDMFSDSFLKGLIPIVRDGITYWSIRVIEKSDVYPRCRQIVNSRGDVLAEITVPADYIYDWYVQERYAYLYKPDGSGNTEYLSLLQSMYDGSRLIMKYDLVDDDNLIKIVYKQTLAAQAAESDDGGGSMCLNGWNGGSVTNLRFSAIGRTNGACIFTLVYPDIYKTNNASFEIFTCYNGRGLLDFWWEKEIPTTNANSSTNWIEICDDSSSNNYERLRFYVAALYNDVDSDGFTDGFEKYVCHTDSGNSNSYPLDVSGTISYTGSLTGPVRMIAVPGCSNSWAGPSATISVPGVYTNNKVAPETNYWFKAYMDCNNSRIKEYGEPWGVYSNASLFVTNNCCDIDIYLTDRDEDNDGLIDWWEMLYFGDLNEDGSTDPDGDGLVNSNEYSTGANPTLTDTDSDGMGDWAEYVHGNSPTQSDSYTQLPFYESFDIFEKISAPVGSTNFGYSIAIEDDTLVLGACNINGETNGSVFVYNWNGTNWLQTTQLFAWSGSTNDLFGCAVAIYGDRIVVGASHDNTGGDNAGAIYVFRKQFSVWTNEVKFHGTNGVDLMGYPWSEEFGSSVDIKNGIIAIGAPKYELDGRVYIYSFSGSQWVMDDTPYMQGYEYHNTYGQAIALSDDGLKIAIGFPHGDKRVGGGATYNHGKVKIYEKSGSTWHHKVTLMPNDTYQDQEFGNALAYKGNLLVVGCKNHDGNYQDSGAAYIFEYSGGTWSEKQRLKPEWLDFGVNFGSDVAIMGDKIVIGSPYSKWFESRHSSPVGVVAVYEKINTTWEMMAKLNRPMFCQAGYQFGKVLAANDNRFVAGSIGDSVGSVMVFNSNIVSCVDSRNSATLINSYHDWQGIPQSCLTFATNIFNTGSLSCQVGQFGAKLQHLFPADSVTNIWIDSYVRFDSGGVSQYLRHPDKSIIQEWEPSFFVVNGDAELIAYDGSSTGIWQTAENITVQSNSFHRYTVKQDYVNKSWDLYFDGSNVFSNLGFSNEDIPEFSCFSFTGPWGNMAYIDTISIDTNQPTF